jgi:hypothetical protein
MKNTFKTVFVIAALVLIYSACKKQEYSMGDLSAPSNIVITTEVVGQDATHPDGDGSGNVNITVTADNALAYKVGYNAKKSTDFVAISSSGKVTKKFTKTGINTYTIAAIVYGKGGSSSTAEASVTVRSDFTPDPALVTALTGSGSKTWVVDKDIPAHFGVGPWNVESIRPEWWAGAVDEKLSCCPCFYTATFTFTKVASAGTYNLKVTTDAAFTKTGALAGGLPGIPVGGAEGCYDYPGGTTDFSFVPASSGAPAVPSVPANSPSTQTSIMLSGVETYIGYGAVLKEYEILTFSETTLYLRVQGTETGNAWYIKMKPVSK